MIDRIKLPSFQDLRTQFTYDPDTGVLQYRKKKTAKRLEDEQAGRIFIGKAGNKYRMVTVEFPIGPSKSVFAHRVAWKLETGCEPPDEIDHFDGDGLNNAFANLRDGTNCENSKNTAMKGHNTSGYNGVYKTSYNMWLATMKRGGKDVYIGRFRDIHEAGKAARDARIEIGFTERHGLPKNNLLKTSG